MCFKFVTHEMGMMETTALRVVVTLRGVRVGKLRVLGIYRYLRLSSFVACFVLVTV